jgi:hypothetical protein
MPGSHSDSRAKASRQRLYNRAFLWREEANTPPYQGASQARGEHARCTPCFQRSHSVESRLRPFGSCGLTRTYGEVA